MKTKIEQLANGIFDYELPIPETKPERLIIHAEAGKKFTGSFCISNSMHTRMKGVLYSDHLLMQCEKQCFSGDECHIPYVFHAESAKAGERYEGSISIVTDAGELRLPYEVKVLLPHMMSSAGEIRDLFQFATLARQNRKEAEQLFFDEAFAQAIFYRDKHFETLYRTLVENDRKEMAMELFLVAVGKKQPVELIPETTSLHFDVTGHQSANKVVFQKRGWGYAEYSVRCDADWVLPDRLQFSTQDFVQECFELGFMLQTERLTKGNHRAVVHISSVLEQYEIVITCEVKAFGNIGRELNRKLATAKVMMVQNYLQFTLGKCPVKQYLAEADRYLAVLRTALETDEETELLARLYQVHIWQTADRDNPAKSILASLGEGEWQERISRYPEAEAAYYFLHTRQKHPQYTQAVAAEKIRALYADYPNRGLILWFLIQLDPVYRDGRRVLSDIREYTQREVVSALLRAQALQVIREDASLLHTLDSFDLSVLLLGVKKQCLGEDLRGQMVYLAARERALNPLLFRVLCACYEQKQDKELLAAICTLIIRSGVKWPKYYPWLKKGVELQLRITRLEEFYIGCMDDNARDVIPAHVYLYFSYHCELNDRQKALLYANLVYHRSTQYPVYAKNREVLAEFALQQLAKGAFSENLALLYNDVFADGMTEDGYRLLPDIAFFWRVKCQLSGLTAVCVCQPGTGNTRIVPLVHACAYIQRYTEDAEVFLVGEDGMYYPLSVFQAAASKEAVSCEKMMHLDGQLWRSYEAGNADMGLLLYLEEQMTRYQRYSEHRQEVYRSLFEQEGITREQQSRFAKLLAEFYYENYESEWFEFYLRRVDLTLLEKKERCEMLTWLLMRDFDKEAYEVLSRYDADGVEVRRVSKLTEHLLAEQTVTKEEPVLLHLLWHVFERGKCGTAQLMYLAQYFQGTTDAMSALWAEAHKHEGEIDTTKLEENLLAQILFTESRQVNGHEVFRSYYEHGKNRLLIRAYLNYYAYKYISRDRMIPQELFEIMNRELMLEENDVCAVAVLKRYASMNSYPEQAKNLIARRLQGLTAKGIFLSFFRTFEHLSVLPENVYDRHYVEYCADERCNVKIHYRLESEEKFSVRTMKNIFCGIFSCDFVLFEEESLQYYITEEKDGVEKLTESTTITMERAVAEGHSFRYDQLNMILEAHQMQEENTVLQLLNRYICTQYEAEHLFKQINSD